MSNYLVLAYYYFGPIADPQALVAAHKAFFAGRDVAGRIYISHDGINGQMSGIKADAEAFMQWLQTQIPSIEFKIHQWHENVFPRMTVKVRKQLVAIDKPVDLDKKGTYLSPQQWRAALEGERDFLLLDVRNNYESEVGTFEGAVCPPLETFRDFPAYVQSLKEQIDPKTKVLMFCTGGIRCELFSSLMKEEGFDNVQQLHGGVIQYGLEEGAKHWKGKLFVFDDRLTIPIGESSAISSCHKCGCAEDTYYNCANMDCNELFVSCRECATALAGCCSTKCKSGQRLRPYNPDQTPKPFRKKHLLCGCNL